MSRTKEFYLKQQEESEKETIEYAEHCAFDDVDTEKAYEEFAKRVDEYIFSNTDNEPLL